jgi:hypothetical protein
MNRETAFQLQIAREAKQARDEAGHPDAKGDRVLAYYEMGIFNLDGIDIMADSPEAYLLSHSRPLPEVCLHDTREDYQPPNRFSGNGQGSGSSRPATYPASPKQVAFIKTLLAERDTQFTADVIAEMVKAATADKAKASKLITSLLALPKAAAPVRTTTTAPRSTTPAAPLELGMYRKADGTLYRVYPARSANKHLLAKRLIVTQDGVNEQGEPVWHGEFEYAGAAARFVKADERMTLEEAKEFGHQFGICCDCAALLTDPTSVANGIGPVCGSRY